MRHTTRRTTALLHTQLQRVQQWGDTLTLDLRVDGRPEARAVPPCVCWSNL
jgi:hypothetical protein